MHSCTRIPGKQWFLQDIPGVTRIVGRYDLTLSLRGLHSEYVGIPSLHLFNRAVPLCSIYVVVITSCIIIF